MRPRRKIFKHQRNIFSPDSERNRRHSYAGPAPPPREFFCPLSKCLMIEPVTLLNTGVTLSRTGMQAWLRTGTALHISCSVVFSCHPALRVMQVLRYPHEVDDACVGHAQQPDGTVCCVAVQAAGSAL